MPGSRLSPAGGRPPARTGGLPACAGTAAGRWGRSHESLTSLPGPARWPPRLRVRFSVDKMQDRIDLYAVLSLTRACSSADVKRAFKKLALQTHPDKGKGLDAEFIAIALAYHVLCDPKLRAAYDANEREFSKTRQSLVESFDLDKALEIFSVFFGTANPFAAANSGVNELFDAAESERQPKPAPKLILTLVRLCFV